MGSGELNGGEFIWSEEDSECNQGVGFLLNKKAKETLFGYKPVSTCIMLARFTGTSHNLSIIQVYAPTADSTEEELIFYKDLDECIQDTGIPSKDILMLTGDWNAKVGSINYGWEATIGKYGYGKCNDSGEALLEFALDNDGDMQHTIPTERMQKVNMAVTKSAYNQHDRPNTD